MGAVAAYHHGHIRYPHTAARGQGASDRYFAHSRGFRSRLLEVNAQCAQNAGVVDVTPILHIIPRWKFREALQRTGFCMSVVVLLVIWDLSALSGFLIAD